MDLVERLLQAADIPVEVVDDVLPMLKRSSFTQYDEIEIASTPSDDVALSVAAKNGAKVAEGIALSSKSPAVLERLAAKDKRRSVVRAVLVNEHTPMPVKLTLLNRALDQSDDDTVEIAARKIDPAMLLSVKAERPSALRFGRYLVTRARRCNDADELRVWMTASDEDIRTAALIRAAGGCDDIELDEAISLAGLSDEAVADVLWNSPQQLHEHHARILVSAAASTVARGWRTSSGVNATCDADASAVLAKADHPSLQWLALATEQVSDAVLTTVLDGLPTQAVLARAVEKVTSTHQATMVVEALIRAAAAEKSEAPRPAQPYAVRRGFSTAPELRRSASNLMDSDKLDSASTVALVRAFPHVLMESWLTGRFANKPRPGEIRAVFADGKESLMGESGVNEWCSAYAFDHPWTVELLETVPGAVGFLMSQSCRGPLGPLVKKVGAAFGPDPRPWHQLLSFGPGYPGTLGELLALCAAASGVTLRDDSTPDCEQGTLL